MSDSQVSIWLHGLAGAFISGGASAVTGGITTAMIAPNQFNLDKQIWHLLGLMGSMFLVNGLLGAFFYLKQSPVPPPDAEEKTNAQVAGK